MSRSGPRLHPPLMIDRSEIESVSSFLTLLVEKRQATSEIAIATDADIRIPIDSVSKDGNFDAYVHVGLAGGGHPNIKLLVDSGNSTLILPRFDEIQRLPNFKKSYKIEAEDVREPWGAPANIVTGPIVLPRAGGTHTISSCTFYACTDVNDCGEYTANFGIGCVDPWSAGDSHELRSPLSYGADYVQIDYAPVDQVLASGGKLRVAPGSYLTLCRAKPDGFSTTLKILQNLAWMALKPQSLVIGAQRTDWPGKGENTSVAMIDTAGGPVFLSDPENYLRKRDWPETLPETIPDFWVSSCKGMSADLAFSLTDGKETVLLTIRSKALTPAVQGLSLIMCDKCEFMRAQDGMNIGGLTALFYSILIDYKNARVGFKPKLHSVREPAVLS
ncbi:hypothetical protein ACVWZ4_000826 [Bradyrhizobium sp. USDA 4472]